MRDTTARAIEELAADREREAKRARKIARARRDMEALARLGRRSAAPWSRPAEGEGQPPCE
jgi:hypothetical protein